jgi:YVTN family beta-propeller protein
MELSPATKPPRRDLPKGGYGVIQKTRLDEVCRLGSRTVRILAMVGAAAILAPAQTSNPNRTVGPQTDGSIVVSDNQTLTPAGKIIDLGSPVRAKSIALNPNGRNNTGAVLAMGSSQPIVVFSSATGEVLQRFIPSYLNGTESKTSKAGSFTGITYSSDGKRLFFSQDDNHFVIADVNPQTGLLTNGQSVELPEPPADGRPYYKAKAINPGGIAIPADGKRAYVVLNVANTLGVIDLTASPAKLIAQIPVGNAPNSVVIHGKYGYVSNEGGRPATSDDFTNYSDGTRIVVDRKDAFAITGTVSVVDLSAGKEIKTIKVGLHPAGMTISGSNLYVANAYSDSLSIIDLNTDQVERTIDLSVPIAGGVFGSGPNGVAVTEDGRAYVTLGQANAVAAINLQGRDAHPVLGYIPTGYFPTSIAYDKTQKQLVVADDKGLGTHVPARSGGLSGFNTHQDTGTVNLIPLPNANELARFSKQVFDNNHWNLTTNI